jgi:hypothetical protein
MYSKVNKNLARKAFFDIQFAVINIGYYARRYMEDHEQTEHFRNRVELPEPATPDETAAALGIAEPFRRRPEVQAFCGVYAQVEQLQTTMDELTSGGSVDQFDDPDLARVFGDPEQTTPVDERYAAGELLLRGLLARLKEGMDAPDGTGADDIGYAMRKIDSALSGYGYTVVKADED